MTRTVLIAGYGAFGALHAHAWRRIDGVRLQVVEADASGRESAKADGVADVFGDIGSALDDADIVDIVTPPATHVPIALVALGHGLPVLVEKPAARSVADALVLQEAARGTPAQVCLILRAHPLTARARQMLATGAIGRLVSMSGDFSGWKRMRTDSSLLENDGVHFLDLMRYLTGSPITEIDAIARASLGGPIDDIRIDTCHASGIAGELRLGLVRGGETADSVVSGALTRKELTLCGDAGILTLDFNRNRLFHGRVTYRPAPGGWQPSPGGCGREEVAGGDTIDLLEASFRRFLACVDGAGSSLCTVEEGAVELAQVSAAVECALARPRTAVPVTTRRESAA